MEQLFESSVAVLRYLCPNFCNNSTVEEVEIPNATTINRARVIEMQCSVLREVSGTRVANNTAEDRSPVLARASQVLVRHGVTETLNSRSRTAVFELQKFIGSNSRGIEFISRSVNEDACKIRLRLPGHWFPYSN